MGGTGSVNVWSVSVVIGVLLFPRYGDVSQVLREGKRPACAAPAVGSHCWLWLPSEQPLVREAEIGDGAIAHDDMIDDRNTEQLPGVHQPLREGAILAAGLRVTAGVVVAAEDSGRVGQDGGFKCFAHMHHTRRQAPDGAGIGPDG